MALDDRLWDLVSHPFRSMIQAWGAALFALRFAAMLSVAIVGGKYEAFLSRKAFLFFALSAVVQALTLFGRYVGPSRVGYDLCVLVSSGAAAARVFLSGDESSSKHDAFPGLGVMIPVLLLSLLIGIGRAGMNVVFVISSLLDAFAMIPLLVMIESKGAEEEPPAFVRLFVASLCVHGAVTFVYLPANAGMLDAFLSENFGFAMLCSFLKCSLCALWYVAPKLFDPKSNSHVSKTTDTIVV